MSTWVLDSELSTCFLSQLIVSCEDIDIFKKDIISYYNCILRHAVVCQRPRKQQNTCDTNVLFTGRTNLPNSAFCISKTAKLISTKFICFALHIHCCTYQI